MVGHVTCVGLNRPLARIGRALEIMKKILKLVFSAAPLAYFHRRPGHHKTVSF